MDQVPFDSERLLPRTDDLPENPTAEDVRIALERDSARVHEAFVAAFRCLDADGVVRGMGKPTHAARPAYPALAGLRQRGQVLAIHHRGGDLYPAFQFGANGQPRPDMATILSVLLPHRTPWQVALWFVRPNGWLDGDLPKDRLGDKAVVTVAHHETEGIEG